MREAEKSKDKLAEVLDVLDRARKAMELLDEVWSEIDAYSGKLQFNQGTISNELLMKLRDYYDFDDSE